MMERFIAQFKALPPWQKYFLLLGLPIIAMVYLWLMLVSPTIDEINRLKTDIQKEETEIQTIKNALKPEVLEDLKKQEQELMQEYQLKQAELVSLVGEIPTERDMPLVIKNIGAIAQRSKLTILNIQVSSPQKATFALYVEGDKKIVKEQEQQQQQQQEQQQQQAQEQRAVSFLRSEVRIQLLGTYPSVKTFLNDLRRRGVISYPVSLTITPEGQKVRAEVVINILMKEGDQL